MRGFRQEAITAAEKARSLAPWSTTTRGLFAGLLNYSGQLSAADQLRNGLLPADQYGAAMGLALFHLGCSEIDQAAQWAEKAIEQRDTRMVVLIALVRAFWPSLFRSDSRWSGIARRLGIPSEVVED